jgi:peptidyl-prolyl cis-trans isomerase B (cyclophilin B)
MRLPLIIALISSLVGATLSTAAALEEKPKAAPQDEALMKIDEMIQNARVDTSKPDWRTTLPKPQKVTFDRSHKYFVQMVTNKGTMKIRLMPQVAPMHVTSFLYLTRLGFYDGLTFHRVIPGFMAQGGCPLGNGRGGPGYRYDAEIDPSARHDQAGVVSTANAGPGTDGSQFFITFAPTPWLDGKHTVFGSVAEGLDTLKAIEAAGSKSGHPTEPIKIIKATAEIQ